MSQTFIKDPDAVLDYTVDWTEYLNGTSPEDTISTSSWSADGGITVDSSDNNTKTATVWLSGGTAGRKYSITNQIVTSGGRTDERTITVNVFQR